MRRYSPAGRLAIAIAILGVALSSAAQTTSPTNASEQAVRQQETQYANAVKRQDIPALRSMLAEEFLATSSSGELRNKAMELDDLKPNPGYTIDDFRLDDIRIRLFDTTAIVTGREILEVRYNKQPLTSLLRYTRVYVKRENGWQIVAQQLTSLPQQTPR
jgi:ketosteroid isomerase-like protein